jgi:hypothetical protein
MIMSLGVAFYLINFGRAPESAYASRGRVLHYKSSPESAYASRGPGFSFRPLTHILRPAPQAISVSVYTRSVF